MSVALRKYTGCTALLQVRSVLLLVLEDYWLISCNLQWADIFITVVTALSYISLNTTNAKC